MDDPAPELEAETAPLVQMAWKLGEFWKACRAAGLPDDLSHEVVMEWYASQVEEPVAWRDDGGDG